VLGAGRYEHVEASAFEKRRAGLWHVKLSGTSRYDGRNLPHPCSDTPSLSTAVPAVGASWQPTAQVALALDVEYHVEIESALLFAESHRILGVWHDRIKAATDSLNEASQYRNNEARLAARECVKAIRKQCIGKFSSEPTPMTRSGPDWRGAMISEARQCMIRNIATCVAADAVPFACNVDSLYFVSNHREVSQILLRLGNQMGQYKHLGTFPLAEAGPVVRWDTHCFGDEDQNPARGKLPCPTRYTCAGDP
jgi:hypothetical protein